MGHFDDPEEIPGLAHFLEHMLFMGTEKYPDEGDYGNFLKSHGGVYNAYTASELTNYFFQVDSAYFLDTLDRYSLVMLY